MLRDKVEELQTDIEAGVAALVGGDDSQRWLQIQVRFPEVQRWRRRGIRTASMVSGVSVSPDWSACLATSSGLDSRGPGLCL
jgi:hypothetical protein